MRFQITRRYLFLLIFSFSMQTIKNAISHFVHFHRGAVNIVLHVIGFTGLFYSIYKRDWILFALFLFMVEVGHVYNHVAGIKPYDFRLPVIFWRVSIFIAVVLVFYFLANFFQ